jgi:hypothetical protein
MSCIIVLGCYRSGTSAVAGILQHLGVVMGKNFDPPTQNNMSGYWEDVDFKNLHAKFDAGEADGNPELSMEYMDLVRKREQEFELWGLKDPLLCTNLPRFVNCLTTDSKLIVCRRNTHEIATSMAKALKEKNHLRFVPLAEFYVDSMNKNLLAYRGPILEMDHSHTIGNPDFHINRIANFLSLPVTKKAMTYIKKKTDRRKG